MCRVHQSVEKPVVVQVRATGQERYVRTIPQPGLVVHHESATLFCCRVAALSWLREWGPKRPHYAFAIMDAPVERPFWFDEDEGEVA